MLELTANYKTKKFDLIDEKGNVIQDVANLLIPIEIIGALEEGSETFMTLETYEQGQSRTFDVKLSELSSQTDCNRVLTNNLYFINFKLVNHLRQFITYRLQELQAKNRISFSHRSLGFWQDIDDSTIFLLGQNQTKRGVSNYYKDTLSFQSGKESDYIDFMNSEILPYSSMQLAFAMGLSSVTASYLKDYADVGTIVLNFCGASSTGKSTTAQFIASLWADPRIGNDSLVRTFNSTQGAMMQSIEGFNGVPIILDDATTAAYMNKTTLVYQLAQGEARARLVEYGRSIRQGQEWSGCVIITSELPILSESETRQGLIARVIDTNDMVWTDSAEHAVRIKNFIKENYGHLGERFASYFLGLSDSEITKSYQDAKDEILAAIVTKDNLTERIVNKLAIIYMTSNLAINHFGFELDLESIKSMLIEFDQVDVDNRHIAIRGLDAIKLYVQQNHSKFDKYDPNGTQLEHSKGSLSGIITFYKDTMDVAIPSEIVKSILRSNRIYEYKPVLKYWGNKGIIAQQSGRNTINLRHLDSRAVKFHLERTAETMIPWLYEAPNFYSTDARPLIYKDNYNQDEDIKAIFDSFDRDEGHAN
jgi:hypothetical protein